MAQVWPVSKSFCAAPFAHQRYTNSYATAMKALIEQKATAMKALIEQKAKGERVIARPSAEARRGKVIRLMDALKSSLKTASSGLRRQAPSNFPWAMTGMLCWFAHLMGQPERHQFRGEYNGDTDQ